MEDNKVSSEEKSVLPLPSERDANANATTEVTKTAAEEPAPASSVKESAPAEQEKAPEAPAPSAPASSEAPSTEAGTTTTATTAATTTTTASRSSSRRSSGVSGIAHRVHRHETRSATEGRLPSRYSDFEVESPRQSQPSRTYRQRSNESLKKGTPASTAPAAPATAAQAKTDQAVTPAPPPPAAAPPASDPASAPAQAAPAKEVDPADELEMMLMSRGAIPAEPPAKKPREDAATPKKATTDAKAATPSTEKKSKSKRKSLVEGREARVVKPKFSLEQEMSLPDELQKCLGVLNNMFRQDECAPFYYAVDPIRLNIPDYWDVIKHPMDMSKIKENLLNGKYADSKDFQKDVHLMFENARTYNPAGHPVHILADRLEKSFEEQLAKIHARRPSSVSTPPVSSASSPQPSGSKSSKQSSSSSKRNRSSLARQAAGSSVSSDSSSSSSDSSDSDSSEYSDSERRKKKQKHHGRHHHHHHRHGKKGEKVHGKKRSRSSSSLASDIAAYEESIRRAELEKLQNEVRLLKNQLLEQKQSKAKAASIARAEKAAAAAKRVSKSTSKRPPLSFDTTPDPDRPVTEEDKRRISGNINRLPPERMLPLVSFVQEQIPPLSLVIPGHPPMLPSEIEVDLDTLDNRTLRTVDHKVRQALALAGQARRRAERRLLEQQMQREQQLRHHANLPVEQRVVQAKSLFQNQVLTPQQTAMNYMDSLRRGMSSNGAVYAQQDAPLPGTPGSAQSAPRSNSDMENEDNLDPEEDEVAENDVIPNLPSDSESSSSSSSSSDSEGDDMMPETFAPPPSLVPGSGAAAPISLSQATAMSSAQTSASINPSS